MIDEIRKRLAECPIPMHAQADWEGTNHYEIQNPDIASHAEYWWLDSLDECLDSGTEGGKRLGAVLYYAVAYRRDVSFLLAEIDRLKGTLERYAHCRHASIDCFCVKEARAALYFTPKVRP